MKLIERSFGKKAKRIDFARTSNELELPKLIEIQTKTYDWLKTKGINEVFNEVFPIYDRDKKISLKINNWKFLSPRRTISQAKEESKTYEAAISAELSLTISETDVEVYKEIDVKEGILIQTWIEDKIEHNIELKSKNENVYFFDMKFGKSSSDKRSEVEIIVKENHEDKLIIDYTIWKIGEVFFGDLPLMTNRGTFIINGSEKVIVSQLVRSPGAYYKKQLDRKIGELIHNVDLIPSRGAWLEIETEYKKTKINNKKVTNNKRTLNVKIDKSRKTTITNLLTSLGLSKLEVLEIFDNNEILKETYKIDNFIESDQKRNWKYAIQELYKKMRSGETTTSEGATKYLQGLLFDERKYDLTSAGRFKLTQKLSIHKRVINKVLAEDVKDKNGNVLFEKDTLITKRNINEFVEALKNGAASYKINYLVNINSKSKEEDDIYKKVKIYLDEHSKDQIETIIGINPNCKSRYITIPDIISTISYLLNLMNEIGEYDDIDHLGNRRVRTTGELLQNQFRIGLLRIEKNLREKMSTTNSFKIRPSNVINNKPLSAVIGEFFNLSQLSQFMDQTNPLSELTNKRRLTALGPAGLSRERAGLEVRDVHYSHYGRICPIETPEGPNIGLINNLSTYAKINKYGFITTPYRLVKNNKVLNDYKYLTADDERDFVIAQASIKLSISGDIIDNQVIARYHGETALFPKDEIDYVDVSPKQIVSIATSCIPFLENDDANRALMGANMQRQAIPLLKPESPLIGTGVEHVAARDSGLAILAEEEGKIVYVDANSIIIENKKGKNKKYNLSNFERSNQGTPITHTPIIEKGEKVEPNQIIADGPSMENGELALGQNVLVAFTTWNGFNYEDAIIISDRLVKDDTFTSIHIEEYSIERRQTKLGDEEITREIPNISEQARRNLGNDGVIKIGSEVKAGDILVGKVTPKGQTKLSPEDKLLQAIFGEKSKNVKDNSLRLPNGGNGIVQDVKYFSKKHGHDLASDVLEIIKVYIVQKRKIQEGDKMSGRHGNKGIISRILPSENMPFLPDGTPIDVMLNPLGVPSRMNIGQILEIHLGMAAKNKNVKVATPVFEGLKNKELNKFILDSGISKTYKTKLIDGCTGEPLDNEISVGIMYMLKLSHMVDDKIHARSVGPYSLITQQPLGGKAQNGGQRFGEMEVWALEAYGAAHILREILTIKSDDIMGRVATYESIVRGLPIPKPGIPESFNVLTKEIQGLGFNIHLIDENGNKKNITSYNKENYQDYNIDDNLNNGNNDKNVDSIISEDNLDI